MGVKDLDGAHPQPPSPSGAPSKKPRAFSGLFVLWGPKFRKQRRQRSAMDLVPLPLSRPFAAP
jgi:hypothetical protein